MPYQRKCSGSHIETNNDTDSSHRNADIMMPTEVRVTNNNKEECHAKGQCVPWGNGMHNFKIRDLERDAFFAFFHREWRGMTD